jgi:hypothetical protein
MSSLVIVDRYIDENKNLADKKISYSLLMDSASNKILITGILLTFQTLGMPWMNIEYLPIHNFLIVI